MVRDGGNGIVVDTDSGRYDDDGNMSVGSQMTIVVELRKKIILFALFLSCHGLSKRVFRCCGSKSYEQQMSASPSIQWMMSLGIDSLVASAAVR